jgi:hypothetical protein
VKSLIKFLLYLSIAFIFKENLSYGFLIKLNYSLFYSPIRSFARNIRGRLGFSSESEEEMERKKREREAYYKEIQLQIEEKNKRMEIEKHKRLLDEINEEKKIKNQLKKIDEENQLPSEFNL